MKKCYGITEGRTEGRTEPRTDVNQYTPLFFKAGVYIFNSCGDIFDKKFGKKEKGTNKRKNK